MRRIDDEGWALCIVNELGIASHWIDYKEDGGNDMPYLLALIIFSIAAMGNSEAASPYVGQELRAIQALSSQEVSNYLSGNGMGFAKAAELNGYPGPAHVLEYAVALKLTAEQQKQTEALFQLMKSTAITLGEELVGEERALDHMFASRAATPDSLAIAASRISTLQGEIRRVHLDVHLRQTAILTSTQIRTYANLRGYEAADPHDHAGKSHD